jgi:hypothetical protein
MMIIIIVNVRVIIPVKATLCSKFLGSQRSQADRNGTARISVCHAGMGLRRNTDIGLLSCER